MTQPLVSIILPTYNGKAERFSEAVNSVLSQTYQNRELIIINDASTNNIEKTILQWVEKDQRIKYIKNEQNMKQAASRNKGIKQAKGQYIAFIDDDDIWSDPQKLEKQILFLEQNNEYVFCGTYAIVINEQGDKIYTTQGKQTDQEIRNNLLLNNQFVCSSVVMKNKGYYFDLDFGGLAEDYEFWTRVGRTGKMHNLPFFGLKYRVNLGGSTQRNRQKMQYATWRVYWKNKFYYPNSIKKLIWRIGGVLLHYKIADRLYTKLKPNSIVQH